MRRGTRIPIPTMGSPMTVLKRAQVLRHAALLIVSALVLAGCSKQPTLTTSSPEALRLYRDGTEQYEKFYYREAKASIEQALSYDSTFAMAWARLAAVNMNNQNESEALVDIGRAIALMGKASRREQLVIRMLDRRFHYDDVAAAEIADSLIRLYPEEKEAYVIRGIIHQIGNNLEKALQCYRQASDVDTGYALAYMYIGYAYSNLGEQDKALSAMQHYIQLAPDAANPHASYANLLMRVGRYDEALEQHRKALSLKPDYWYSFMQIGNIYGLKGRLKDAEAQFHKSLTLRPPNRTLEATHLAVAGYLDRYQGEIPRGGGTVQERPRPGQHESGCCLRPRLRPLKTEALPGWMECGRTYPAGVCPPQPPQYLRDARISSHALEPL